MHTLNDSARFKNQTRREKKKKVTAEKVDSTWLNDFADQTGDELGIYKLRKQL